MSFHINTSIAKVGVYYIKETKLSFVSYTKKKKIICTKNSCCAKSTLMSLNCIFFIGVMKLFAKWTLCSAVTYT